jgi:hypothetical protein
LINNLLAAFAPCAVPESCYEKAYEIAMKEYSLMSSSVVPGDGSGALIGGGMGFCINWDSSPDSQQERGLDTELRAINDGLNMYEWFNGVDKNGDPAPNNWKGMPKAYYPNWPTC